MMIAHALTLVMCLNSGESLPNPLELSPEIKAYIDTQIRSESDHKIRVQRIIETIFSEDRINLKFSEGHTMTATETFYARKGNCLSFTNLFVAMAREAGVGASFKEVQSSSNFNRSGEVVIHDQYLIASVQFHGRVKDIDFHSVGKQTHGRAQYVDDRRALAHYFNNLGAEHFTRGDLKNALLFYEKAQSMDPTFVPVQINMGVYWHAVNSPEKAIEIFEKVLDMDKKAFSALANLAKIYQELNKKNKANETMKRMSSVFHRNPYYFHQMGEWAFGAKNYHLAIKHFKKAITLKSNEPLFLQSLSKAHFQLGNMELSKAYFQKALELVEESPGIRYSQKLELLASLN